MIGEALKEVSFVRADAEMEQLHLRLGPCERGGAPERCRVMMLVRKVDHFVARGGGHPSRMRRAPSRRAGS